MLSCTGRPLRKRFSWSRTGGSGNKSTENSHLLGSSNGSSEFLFKNCSYTIPVKDKTTGKWSDKQVLDNVSGIVKSQEVLAIMGPSGAGKTVLLNLLTLNPLTVDTGPGKATGKITLNDAPFSRLVYNKHCAFVTQVDRHWAFLTTREHLEFAFKLHQPHAKGQALKELVDNQLAAMGLTACQHTKAGNEFVKGLSGGQKRRLSLGVALAKSPALVFLDEPTSGLDSAAAASIVAFLKETSGKLNFAIACTIHQPSYTVFNKFDRVLVLSTGRTAFFGSVGGLGAHLELIGHPIPANENPADFMLELVNKDFTEPESVEKILQQWEETAAPLQSSETTALRSLANETPSCGNQLLVLLQKHLLLTVRDPTLYLGRMLFFAISCCFFAVIYVKCRDRIQDQVLPRLFLIMWFAGVPCCMGCVAVFALNKELQATLHEVRDGMYKAWQYMLVHTLIQLPLMFVLSVAALGPSAYGIANFNTAGFAKMIIVYSAQLWAFESMAQFYAVQFVDPTLGMLNFMNSWFLAFLFSGILLPEDNVVWPFRMLSFVFPFRWGVASMVHTEFINTQFLGTEECELGPDDLLCNPRGFKCPDDETGMRCFGRSGADVLKSININYESFSDEDTMLRDVLYCIAFALFFKMNFSLRMLFKSKSAVKIMPPVSSAPSAPPLSDVAVSLV